MATGTGSDDINVGFGASIDGLVRGMADAARAVFEGSSSMQKSLGGIVDMSSKVVKGLLAVGAVVAGGALFGKAVSETSKLGYEVGNLARYFDITAGEASAMAVAIDDAYMTIDEFMAVNRRLGLQLRQNEEALNSMGIKTRDGNKQWLDTRTVLDNTLNSLRQYKAGTDQNLAASVAFGRGMDEHMLQKLFAMQEGMKEARQDAEDLGLVFGVQNVEAAKEFKKAQDNVGDAMQGVTTIVGNALMPVFTILMNLFTEGAKQFIPALRASFSTLGVVMLGIIEIGYGIFQVFKVVLETLTIGLGGLIRSLVLLVQGDFKGAKASFEAISESIADSWDAAGKRIEAMSKKTRESMSTVWDGPEASADVKVPAPTGRAGTKTFTPYDPKANSEALAQMKRDLELLKAEQGDYMELTKQQEVEFWAARKDVFARGTKEWMEVNTLYLNARRAAAKESVEIARFELEEQVAQARNDGEEKVRLAESWLARMIVLYGVDSAQYREALRRKRDAEREFEQQRRQILDARATAEREAREVELEIAREKIAFLVEIGEISKQQQAALERGLIEEKYRIASEDIERRRALYADDKMMLEQLNNEKRRLDAALNKDLGANALQQKRTIIETWDQMLDGMYSSLANITQGLIQRTMTWRQAMQNLSSSALNSFIQMGVQRLRNWVNTELALTSATTAGEGARAGVAATASAAVVAAKTTEATAVVGMNATEAASGAAASQASIPFVGPALAIAAALAMMAFVTGMMGSKGGGTSTPAVPSAAGGWWDIPRDTLAMVHAKEMIMPAHLAESVRSAVEGGGVMGGGSALPPIHIHATDAQSVERLLTKHADRLVGPLLEKVRGNPRIAR